MKILIIDDEEVSIFTTKGTLTLGGIGGEVHSFISAREALVFLKEAAWKNVPDVILLDLNMPEMDGWQFLEALRKDREDLTEYCQIYILTSSLDAKDLFKAQEYSYVDAFIHKQFGHKDVQKILKYK